MSFFYKSNLDEAQGKDLAEEPLKDRKCLSCLVVFQSEHKFNRLCKCCKFMFRKRNENDSDIIYPSWNTSISELSPI